MEFTTALYRLYPQIRKTINDIAYDIDGNEVAYDVDLVNAEAKKIGCKEQAKVLLANTDWTVLTDVPLDNKADYKTYRATLRDLVLNPVVDPVFPDEPVPVWK